MIHTREQEKKSFILTQPLARIRLGVSSELEDFWSVGYLYFLYLATLVYLVDEDKFGLSLQFEH